MPFDARAAKLLQPGEHLILPEHPGLRLECAASRRSWIYRYKSPIDTGMRQLKIGEWPKLGYPEAAVEWGKLRDVREAGRDPQLEKKAARRQAQEQDDGAKGPYTVAQLVQDYLTGHIDQKRKPKGRAEVRRLLEAHTKPIATRPAALLLRSEAFDLIEAMSATPVLAHQVRQELGAAWDYGLDSGRLEENTPNWWRQVLRGKMPRSKGKKIAGEHVGTTKRALSEQELGQLVNWLPNFSRTVEDALTLYLWTGTRGAEIMAMERAEVTEEPTGWWWTIPKSKTKNARHENATDLRVPLIGRAKAVVLRRMEQHDGYLFPSPGKLGYVEQKTIQSTVYSHQPYSRAAARKSPMRLPVTRWAPHDLRRSVRTLLAKMGCPKDVAESVLGHMLPGVEGVYNLHTYDDERLEWLTRVDARLEQLAQQMQAAAAS